MFASHFARVKAEKRTKKSSVAPPSAKKDKSKKSEDPPPVKEHSKRVPPKLQPDNTKKQSSTSPSSEPTRKRKRNNTNNDRRGNDRGGPRRVRPTPEALELSRQLQDLSRQKRSADLIELFWKKEHANIRDNHHACIVVDCCSRCGEVEAAEKVVKSLPKTAVSIETKTALLKCYAHSGHIVKAMNLFRQMCQNQNNSNADQRPNVRTLNTLLRGCLWTAATKGDNGVIAGGVVSSEEAWSLYKTLHNGQEDAVDTSSYEATIILLCEALRTEDAQGRIQELQDQYGIVCKGKASVKGGDQSSLETCGIGYLSLARAWAMMGRTDDMWVACQRCLHAIQGSLTKLQEDSSNIDTPNPAKAIKATDRGGKRGWKVDSSEEGQKRAASNLAYRKHRLTEVENEARSLLKRRNSAKELSSSALCSRLQSKLLYFSGGATQQNSSNETQDSAEIRSSCAVWHSFGVESLAKADKNVNREEVEAKKTLQEDGVVNASSIFGKKNKKKPIDVEIGSGFGDWIVRQALAFPDRNHFAVELRADRVYQIFSRGTLAGSKPLDNLCAVGSDAGAFLRYRLPKCSVATVFASHPEPPTQTLGQNINADLEGLMDGSSAEPVHMLNSDTLSCAGDVLEKGGRLVVVTDNRNFANLVAATFVRLLRSQNGKVKCLEPSMAKKMKLKMIEQFPNDVYLYEGQPSVQLGHARDSMLTGQSYFDRLWKTGAGTHSDTTRRYVVVFYKH